MRSACVIIVAVGIGISGGIILLEHRIFGDACDEETTRPVQSTSVKAADIARRVLHCTQEQLLHRKPPSGDHAVVHGQR